MRKTIALILLAISAAISEILCCYLPASRSGSTCDELKKHLMRRDQWRAVEPAGTLECMWGPVRYVIIHHTVNGECSTSKACSEEMRKLQKDHVANKKWPDVGYHYVIGGDAMAYVGRPCNKMGGHTKNHNRKSIGIAFFGDYQKDSPAPKMLDLVPKIASCAVEQGYLHPNFLVIGHRDVFCSTCPGDALYQIVKKWPRFPDTVPVPSYTCDASEVTTEAPETTPMPTTTTTESSTTTVATSTEDASSILEVVPVYIYFLLSGKKRLSCCFQ